MSSETRASWTSLLDQLGRREQQLPLDGVRVLDLTRVWAGPLGTRQLADLGAEVIRIEHPDSRGPSVIPPGSGLRLGIFPGMEWRPDPWNRQAAFNKLNRNKLSLCLDVQKPGGLEILRRLIAVSDIVVENFSARVMPNWGLDWEALRAINPRLIYLAMPGFGATGPYKDYVANGAIIEPHSGLASLMAYDETQPYRTQATYSDPLVGVVSAWAIIAALIQREQTGEGVRIDLAHTETTTRAMGSEVLASQGGAFEPSYANRDPVFAPQGVYPCAGDDEWLAITVQDDRAWAAIATITGNERWLEQPGLETAAGRLANHELLDAGLASWTSTQDKFAAMEMLQSLGVAAGAVLTNQDMVEDDVLSPDFFVPIEENWGDTIGYPRFPVRFDQDERRQWHATPTLGQHNRIILATLLEMTDPEIDALEQAGTIANRPADGA